MSVTIRIPTPLRPLAGGQETVAVSGGTVAEALSDLEAKHPGLRARLLDDKGQVRRFVNIFANDEDIRFLKNLDTSVKDGDELSIIPAIAGGATDAR
jgi:molybdopterin synthase sulfur carrier subunit